MSKESALSPAKKRARRKRKLGIPLENELNFDFGSSNQSVDDYYSLMSSDNEVKGAISKYSRENENAREKFLEKTRLDSTDLSFWNGYTISYLDD